MHTYREGIDSSKGIDMDMDGDMDGDVQIHTGDNEERREEKRNEWEKGTMSTREWKGREDTCTHPPGCTEMG
jgi:hypothetical protein